MKWMITIKVGSVKDYCCLDLDLYVKKICGKAKELNIIQVEGPVNTHAGTRVRFTFHNKLKVIGDFKAFMEAERPSGYRINVAWNVYNRYFYA